MERMRFPICVYINRTSEENMQRMRFSMSVVVVGSELLGFLSL